MSGISKAVSGTLEETRERHKRYLRAVNNPIRRHILRAIKEGCTTAGDLMEATGLDAKTLDWHMRFLEDGYCVETRRTLGGDVYVLTKEGEVVDYMDK